MAILMISGSLRRNSYNATLLREAARLLPAGVTVEHLARIGELPAYSEDDDDEAAGTSVQGLRAAIAAADSLLIATPEYNGSIPGALKNAVDWASRPFPHNAWRAKPIAVIGASTGIFGAVWAQAELRKALGLAGARVLEHELAVGQAHTAFEPSGELRDPAQRDRLKALVAALAEQPPSLPFPEAAAGRRIAPEPQAC